MSTKHIFAFLDSSFVSILDTSKQIWVWSRDLQPENPIDSKPIFYTSTSLQDKYFQQHKRLESISLSLSLSSEDDYYLDQSTYFYTRRHFEGMTTALILTWM